MNFLVGFGIFIAALIFSFIIIMRMGTLQDRIEEEELKEKRRNGR